MKTTIAIAALLGHVSASKLLQQELSGPVPTLMEKKTAMVQVKTEARAKRDSKVQQKVEEYLLEHGERLAQQRASKNKPVTGHKHLNSLAQAKSKAEVQSDATTLAEAADGLGIYIGAAMKYKNFLTDESEGNTEYKDVFLQEFDIITAENYCKPKQIIKSTDDTIENSYINYDGCHYINDWAVENNIAHKGHALTWPSPSKYPDWYEEITDADVLEAHTIDYIIEVMNEMGELYAWDVVNEAISNSDAVYLKENVLTPVDDYVCLAFTTARAVREANGWDTILFYNEYDFESDQGDFTVKSDKVLELMTDMVDRDCGVDAVGFQTHIDLSYSDENIQGIKNNFDAYADLGLYVQISEIDVRCGKGETNSKYTECAVEEGEEWTNDMYTAQGNVYRKILNKCIYSANCIGFQSWGYTDKYSFLSDPQNGQILDEEYGEKTAYTQLLKKLNNTSRTAAAVVARLAGEFTT